MQEREIKKPPVAPKPKFVVGHKLVPPPVAPKPDVVLGDILQPTKKTKPAIAPKPKVPKCSSFPDVKTAQPSLPKNSKSLETDQDNSSEYLVNLNYKNGAPSGNTAYIISVCSCNFECIHKYGNNTYNNSTIFEQLENLQNIDLGEKPASSLNPKTILDSHNEKFIHKNRVVLKTNFTEEKLKGVLTSSVPPNNGHVRQKPVNKLENNGIKIELTDFVQSSSSLEAITVSSNTHTNINEVIPEISETPLEKVDTDDLCPDIGSKEGDGSPASFGTEGVPSTKALPVPKPRKLRVPCLVRQAGIDLPVEGIKGLETSKCDSAGLSECGFRKTAKINVLVQSVSYNNQEMPVVHKSDITTSVAEKIYLANESSDSKELIPQNILSQVPNEISQPEENVRHSLDCSTVCSVQTVVDDTGSPEALKNTKSSKSNDLPCVVTKPRAKSLSSVDMDRINKPQRETQKKSSLKKFLNMKLSVCIIKKYENVSHYEAITDYENLSFALTEKNACFEWQNSSNIEDHDTSIYEVEEVYEATRSYSKFSR
uniref:Uncharacterized protein n=1 Tax=Sphaerodactylus townsendi TaxID=933632 RepID=A0ACB8FPK9_9SAUR